MTILHHQPDSPAVTATRGMAPSRVARWHLALVAALAVLGLMVWGVMR